MLRADAQEKEGEDVKREGAALAIPRRGGREGCGSKQPLQVCDTAGCWLCEPLV